VSEPERKVAGTDAEAAPEKAPAAEKLTCVLCPIGCELEAMRTERGLDLRGHMCEKGIEFATEEILYPKRNLATSVPVKGSRTKLVSVRLSGRVPREMIFPVLSEIAGLRPEGPIKRGDVLLRNVLGTGADVIATRTVPAGTD
jgi:CxxC motif-containing protein